jgi:hypothetical protein
MAVDKGLEARGTVFAVPLGIDAGTLNGPQEHAKAKERG